jgi:hypothetical protein
VYGLKVDRKDGWTYTRDHADMSSDKAGEKPARRKPKVSWARLIRSGLVDPKPRPKGVGNGKQVNIPVPPVCRLSDGGTQKGRSSTVIGFRVV